MKAKSNKDKMPGGAPKGMNPLEFFRKGGEQRKAMFKYGGHNPPKGHSPLPKKYLGGPDDPTNPQSSTSQTSRVSTSVTPYETKKQKILGIIPTGNNVQTRYGDESVWTGDKFNQTNYKEKQVVGPDGSIKKSTKVPVTNDSNYTKSLESAINAGTINTTEGTTPYFKKNGGNVKSKKKK